MSEYYLLTFPPHPILFLMHSKLDWETTEKVPNSISLPTEFSDSKSVFRIWQHCFLFVGCGLNRFGLVLFRN